MKAIIIEDEINVREGFIKLLMTFCSEVEIIDVADNVEDGIKLIDRSEFDLLFLDINLPDGSGFDLMHRVSNKNFNLIFVTAYDKYAIDAFKLSAVDYLLKPVSPHQLCKAIEKAKKVVKNSAVEKAQLEIIDANIERRIDQSNKIILKDRDSLHLIAIKDILCCKADGSYTIFALRDGKKIVTSLNLKEYEQLLAPYNFLRSHHASLVNLYHILEVKKQDGGYLIMSDKAQLPISARKRGVILEEIKKAFLN